MAAARDTKAKLQTLISLWRSNLLGHCINSPCSLDSVDSCVCGFGVFRFGATLGFRVAIILQCLSLRE